MTTEMTRAQLELRVPLAFVVLMRRPWQSGAGSWFVRSLRGKLPLKARIGLRQMPSRLADALPQCG